jgi:hypothetical protein
MGDSLTGKTCRDHCVAKAQLDEANKIAACLLGGCFRSRGKGGSVQEPPLRHAMLQDGM